MKLKTMQNQKNNLRNEVKQFIIRWNQEFPIDRWWRKKHGIAFGSSQHKEVDFIQMFLEYEEDTMIRALSKSKSEEASEFSVSEGDRITSEVLDDDFDNLNLEDYNDKPTEEDV